MATDLAKAYVQIVPSADGIGGKIASALKGGASSAGDEAGKAAGSSLVSKIKTVIAAAGIGAVLKNALMEGADLQQSLGGVETLFKDSANIVINNAKQAYKTAGMSANEYMEAVTGFSASLLQGLSGDTNKAAQIADMALTDMSDNANKMGTSMDLIQNAYQGFAKQNYTMLDNLKLGYGGTKTEMERLLADAQKLTGVKYDISNLSDVYSAIHAIQENMGITGTTAKEAATTFSGSLASMKAAGKDLLANLTLGEDVRPSLKALGETVFTFVKKNLLPMVGNLLSGIPDLISNVMYMASTALNEVFLNMDDIVDGADNWVMNMANAIVTNAPYFIAAAWRVIGKLVTTFINYDWIGTVQKMLTNMNESLNEAAGEIFGSDGSILDALIQSINENLPLILQKGVDIVTDLVNGILSSIPQLLQSGGKIIEKLTGFLETNMPVIFNEGVNLLMNIVNGIIDNLPAIVSAATDLVVDLLKTVIKYAPKMIEGGFELIGKIAAGVIEAAPKLLAKLPGIISDIKKKFSEIDWLEVGKNILQGIANGFVKYMKLITDAAKNVAKNALNKIKDVLGIHSPSRVFELEVGKMIDMGLAAGIEDNVGFVKDSMKELSLATSGRIDTDFSYRTNGLNGTKSSEKEYYGKLEMMYQMLEKYLPRMANMQVVTETGVMVGQLMPKTNLKLQEITTESERWM